MRMLRALALAQPPPMLVQMAPEDHRRALLCTWIIHTILTYLKIVYLDYTYYINILEDAYGC